METQAVIDMVYLIIRRYLDDTFKVVLFGSQARGDAYDTSDIDIGIIGPAPVPWDTYLAICRDIQTIRTLRHVDVVDLMAVSDTFRDRAIREARDISTVTH